ncbi:GEVED domain-containing protein [Microbacterium sp. HD4P20]|uniref:DUF7927 domain-containing protein n=1 Tax=Microbacterium sp. HD4P20 TaxID=2864874 RepID=UPI0020A4DD21|nr:GEVED domain-containing protein [Microbacterium sp. HD4P20]MCP2638277.1 GEVED domain-containing protein [Microbacterium sp. HD4P20]
MIGAMSAVAPATAAEAFSWSGTRMDAAATRSVDRAAAPNGGKAASIIPPESTATPYSGASPAPSPTPTTGETPTSETAPSVTEDPKALELPVRIAPEDVQAVEEQQPTEGVVISPLAAVGTAGTYIQQAQSWFAYVGPGENLDVVFTKANNFGTDNDTTVRLRGPGGVDETCTLVAAEPVGSVCAFSDRTSTPGIWQVDFDSNGAISRADFFSWSIAVQANGTDLSGRVYSNSYAIRQAGEARVDFSLWYKSERGYLYRGDYRAFNGINSLFTADATGVAELGTCVSAYESMDLGVPGVPNPSSFPYGDGGRLWDPPAGECGDPYKLFFEAPDPSMPPAAPLWDGSSVWLNPAEALPEVSSLSFAPDGPTTRIGQFSFDIIGFTGQLDIQIDANGDGDYSDVVDTTVPAAVTQDGTVTVEFAGLDGNGDLIPATRDINARVAITKVGEIHFENAEVEVRGSLEVTALNGPDNGSKTLRWNDTSLRVADRSGTIPAVDGRAGVDSAGGVHGWTCAPMVDCNANDGISGGWGDFRVVDDWTYHAIEEFAEVDIPATPFDYGDAPSTYATLLADGGAHHALVDGYSLGAEIDSETDGQPNATADGDGADEDGVIFNPALGYPSPTIRTGVDPTSQQPIENTLEVTASADGFVSAWVDWNQDGTFAEDERIANAQPVTAGSNDVTFTQGTNPAGIESYVRVRYSTDAASIAAPTGAAPDGEVEDYRVLFERLVQPDTCTVTGTEYYAFTFSRPVDQAGTGGVGSTARYQNVTVINGVAVDMVVEVTAGTLSPTGFFTAAGDDPAWNVRSDGTIRYSFYEAGTTDPVDINAVFTVNDMDGTPDTLDEVSTWDADDLAAYAITQGSRVVIAESGDSVTFTGHGLNTGDPVSRFQVALEGRSTFEVRWQGSTNAGFTFDGDGDIGIQPPACQDFGDAPDSYGTTVAANGANHTIVPGLLLGSEIDFDPDGQPTAGADGDDSNRLADEDGVADAIVVTVGDQTTVTVAATNSTTSDATLGGWIDLDGSGAFDAGELVTVSVPAGSGAAEYSLVFPAGTTTSDTFARFRLFPDGETVAPIGAATGGEVEDYAVTVDQRSLSFEKTSDATEDTRPGDVVTYTVTATNTGTADYTAANPAVVLDDLSGVLDDGTYNDDAEASEGPTPSYAVPLISWVGPLAAGDAVTIEYTVTIAGGGDGEVRNVAFGPGCEPGDPDCDTTTPSCDPPVDGVDPATGIPCAESELLLPKLTHTKVADTTELPVDGGEVEYTITVTNQGPGVFTDAAPGSMSDDLSGVLDDGTVTDGPTTDIGTATFDAADETIRWEGALGVGEVATITYTVTYDDSTGDNVLLNVACLPAELAQNPGDPCRSVQIPGSALQDRKTVSPASGTAVVAGQDVTYTLYFESTGQADATVDTFDDVSDVLDDATLIAGPTTSNPALQATLSGSEIDITGTVPAGETYTVSYTVTVNEFAQQGDHVLGNVLGGEEGCLTGDPTCRTENPVKHLAVTKTSDAADDVNVGDTVAYTVTVTNDGEGDYTDQEPAVAQDDLIGVIDDATYNGDATASDGSVSYAAPILTWTGALAAGDSVTFTYTVTVTNAGDHVLENAAGPVCTAPEICDPPIVVITPLPHVVPAKSSDPATGAGVNEGDVITYTLSWTNDGEAAGVIADTDDLSDVLDDGDMTAEPVSSDPAVTAVRTGDEIRVTGPIQIGQTITVTYHVTIKPDGDRGNNIARNVLTPEVPPEVCAEGDVDCEEFPPPVTEHPIGEIEDSKTVDPASGTSVVAGQDVTYTLTFQNVGEAPADVDTFDDLTGVLDDSSLTSGPTSSDAVLTATLNGEQIDIAGTIPVGGTVTVTYTVTVNEFAQQGDHVLGNVLGEDCAEDDTSCRTENPVRHLAMTKTSDAAADVNAGDTVTYTVTVTNDGEGDYTDENPAVAQDDLSGVIDDASYNGDATASAGSVSYAAPILTWTGALAAGESETFTYAVTVTNAGDHVMENTAGPVCADPEICDPPVVVTTPLPHVVPAKSSDPATGEGVNAGDVITYTLSWTNDGQAAGVISDTDDLSDVLDDGDVTAEPVSSDPAVTAVRDGDEIRVTGPIQIGQTITVTYQVTVKPDGDRGNNIARNVLTPDVPPEVCAEGDVDCEEFPPPTTQHPIGELDDWKTVDPASGGTVQPGQQVTYTLHFENIGEADVAVDKDDVLTAVLDDATITSMPNSSDPSLAVSPLNGDRFTVAGTLAPGQLVTVTYTVMVNPDGQRGDDRLGNVLVPVGEVPPEECVPADGERPDCTVNHVSNVVPSKSADPESGTDVSQGQQVTYTLTFENVSTNPAAADVAIDYTDYMVEVLDDATLASGPISSDAGVTASVVGDTIWVTGAVASGETVTVTYSVTVKAYERQGDHRLGNVVAITGEDPVCAPGSDLCTDHDLVPPPPPLAVTGGGIAWGAMIAALSLLILGGGALLIGARRRAAVAGLADHGADRELQSL